LLASGHRFAGTSFACRQRYAVREWKKAKKVRQKKAQPPKNRAYGGTRAARGNRAQQELAAAKTRTKCRMPSSTNRHA
jgi:hypothetical protein